MNLLLPIHPEHVDNMRIGKKKCEYRRVMPKRDIDKIYIYETAPVKMVVAEAVIEVIIYGSPQEVWRVTKTIGGISEKAFFAYFKGKETACALIFKSFAEYETPCSLEEFGLSRPPQSMAYVEKRTV